MADSSDFQLPPILAYPSAQIQNQIPPEEWEACLDLWINSVELRLGLSDSQFSKAQPQALGTTFLLSYLTQNASFKSTRNAKEVHLRKDCFRLVKRLLTSSNEQLSALVIFELLGQGSTVYGGTESWSKLIQSLWVSKQKRTRKAVEAAKNKVAEASTAQEQLSWLKMVSTLTKSLPLVATITAAGADYLDTLSEIYHAGSAEVRMAVTENVFYSFLALLQTKHVTILTDNIYHMKSESERLQKLNPDSPTVLSSLLCSTSFLKHFVSDADNAIRRQALIDQLNAYRLAMLHLHPPPVRKDRRKGKERAQEDTSMHMHRAAKVSQVHELFPDLSTTYILKALDAYADDAEKVVAALLEPENLPLELQDQNLPEADYYSQVNPVDLEPRSTPDNISETRNAFDNDDFARLRISSNQLRRGKKEIGNEVETSDQHANSKAAILSALATFDSDDDERDDTYDIADVGGAVDNTVDTDERRPPQTDVNEGVLYKTWKETPTLFARDSKTRASNIRQQLKRETGMSDEQIEGWAIMLNKDKKLQDSLQDKYSTARAFSGQQRALQSTKWQANLSAENSETESGPERSNDSRRMGQAGIRGHRNFGGDRGRGGGSTAGPSGEAAIQQARKRKEQGRGRGGANSRRDARAKKVGRGMGPLPQS
ncbi:hypothetical protein LTS08_001393 [Lithohypha guttulata]|nr:hypothetical protein LTS08_001393 [Lithohypha guttulata]